MKILCGTLVAVLALALIPASGMAAEPRNGRILVSELGVIGSLRGDGTGYRILVEGDDVGNATWSPDRSRFAYYSDVEGELQLHVANADGTNSKHLADPNPFSFSWAPSGRYIAYTGVVRNDPVEGTTCYGIFIVDVATLEVREVTEGPSCRAYDVKWSPTGDQLAVVDGWDSGEPDLNRDIYTVDTVTGALTQLTDDAAVDRAPRWSPDGTSLLFESSRESDSGGGGGCGRRTELFMMRANGSNQRRLTSNLVNPDCGATWSDDGSRIAWTTYVKKEEGDLARPAAINVMRSDGRNKARLTDPRRRFAHDPDFSPDGRWIVYLKSHTRENRQWFDLHKVRADGSRRVRLTRRGIHAGPPDW